MHVIYFTGMISMCMDVQLKRFCVYEICVQKIIIYEGLRLRYFTMLIISTPIYPKIEVFSYISPRFWSKLISILLVFKDIQIALSQVFRSLRS